MYNFVNIIPAGFRIFGTFTIAVARKLGIFTNSKQSAPHKLAKQFHNFRFFANFYANISAFGFANLSDFSKSRIPPGTCIRNAIMIRRLRKIQKTKNVKCLSKSFPEEKAAVIPRSRSDRGNPRSQKFCFPEGLVEIRTFQAADRRTSLRAGSQ